MPVDFSGFGGGGGSGGFGPTPQFNPGSSGGGLINAESLVQQLLARRLSSQSQQVTDKNAIAQAEGAYNMLVEESLYFSENPRDGDTPDTLTARFDDDAETIFREIADPAARNKFSQLYSKSAAKNKFTMRTNLQGVFDKNVVNQAKNLGNEVISGGDPASFDFRLSSLRWSRDSRLASPSTTNPGPILSEYAAGERVLVENTIAASNGLKGREKTYIDMLPPSPGFKGGEGYQKLVNDGIRQDTIDLVANSAVQELQGVYRNRFSQKSIADKISYTEAEQSQSVNSIAGLQWATENVIGRAELTETKLKLDRDKMLASGISEEDISIMSRNIRKQKEAFKKQATLMQRGDDILSRGMPSFANMNGDDKEAVNLVAGLVAKESTAAIDQIIKSNSPIHERAARMAVQGVLIADNIKSHTANAGFMPQPWADVVTSLWETSDASMKQFSATLIGDIFDSGGDAALLGSFSGKVDRNVLSSALYAYRQEKVPGVSWSAALNASKEKFDKVDSQHEVTYKESKDLISKNNNTFLSDKIPGQKVSEGEKIIRSSFNTAVRANFLLHGDINIAREVAWAGINEDYGADSRGNFTYRPPEKFMSEDNARRLGNVDLKANGINLDYEDVSYRYIGDHPESGERMYHAWALVDDVIVSLEFDDENGDKSTAYIFPNEAPVSRPSAFNTEEAELPDHLVNYKGRQYDLRQSFKTADGRTMSVRQFLNDTLDTEDGTLFTTYLHDIKNTKILNGIPIEDQMRQFGGGMAWRHQMELREQSFSKLKHGEAKVQAVRDKVNP